MNIDEISIDFIIHALLWVLGFFFLFRIYSCRTSVNSNDRSHSISVIIPARNEENTLPNLLRSLEGQLSSEYEVIVVDDHSEDRTKAIAEKSGVKVVESLPTPDGWIIDGNGKPTVDPEIFLKGDRGEPGGGMLLPLGGYKGFGLSIIVDLLCGALMEAGCSSTELPRGNGVVMSAIKINSFTAIERFTDRVDALIRSLKSTPTAPGYDEIFMPGELEFQAYEQRRKAGIEIDGQTWRNLESLAKELDVHLG